MKKNKKSGERVFQTYTESFKRKVVEEYISTGTPKADLMRKYGIRSQSGIVSWMKAMGYTTVGPKGINLGATNIPDLKEKADKTVEGAELSLEIKRLKRQLEDERLRSEMYLRMIEIAETEYKLPIRKKRGTK